jgi:pyrroline-5-carboxylate reductase
MKLGIVGGGVMGTAIIERAIASGTVAAADVCIAEVIAARRDDLASRLGVKVTGTATEAMDGADIVLLAVKPQDLGSVKGAVSGEAVIVSIMAGVRVATISAAFGHERIVRAMPNTPAAIGEGISAWTATPGVTPEQCDAVAALLRSIGSEVYVDDEKKIDMATALSGSGPAYVFLFIESLIEAGVSMGLTRAQSEALAIQTVAGSGAYAREAGRSAAELRAAVTSPGGTTAAGLLEMEKGAIRATIIEGVRAAHGRAIELGAGG